MCPDAATRHTSTVLCSFLFPIPSQNLTSGQYTECHKTLWLNDKNKRYCLLGCDPFSVMATDRRLGEHCLYTQSILFKFDVCVSVHHILKWREIPTWCNNFIYYLKYGNSTCFGHLYAHLQEYIGCTLLHMMFSTAKENCALVGGFILCCSLCCVIVG